MLLPRPPNVSVEPVVFLYCCTLALSNLSIVNLLLRKECGGGECDEVSAQKEVTFIQTWREVIVLVGPVVFVMFAGPWSDCHARRRKPLMYLPIVGQVVSDLLGILNVYFWSWSPTAAALMVSVPVALTGWRSCFFTGVITLVCDKTTEKHRTTKVGMCYAMFFVATPCGAFLFGLFFNKLGFYGIYIVNVVMNVTAVVYLFLFVPDNESTGGKLKFWERLIDPSQVLRAFKTVLKPRDGYCRAVLLLAMVATPLALAPSQGEYAVLYFYLRYKFQWDAVSYGYYAAYKLLIMFFGLFLTLGLLSHLLSLSDAVIGALSMVTLVITAAANAFATSVWELFVYPLIDFMHGSGFAVLSSIISKNTDSSERGQVNSILGILDALFPLVNMPLYNQFYYRTFQLVPGAFFLISTVYGSIAFIIFCLIYIMQKKTKQAQIGKNLT